MSLLLAVVFVAVHVPSTAGELGKPVKLVIGSNTAPTHPENQYLRKLKELVEAKSGGNITIDVKDSAVIGDHLERLEGLRLGTIDGTLTSIGFMGGYDPVFIIFEMPYLFRNEKQQYNFFHGDAFKMLADEMDKYGYIFFGAMEMGARHLTNSVRPIRTPADLAGLKIRVPETQSSMDALTAMGGTPTPMAFSELYMGLQQKQVDGQENPFSNIYASKFYEVQKYLSLTGHQRIEQILLFGKLSWDRMTDAQKNLLRECEPAANEYLRDVIAREEAELIGKLEEGGMQVNQVDQKLFIDKVAYLRDEYAKKYGEKAKQYFALIDATKD